MPYPAPHSLSDPEVYALTAYLLNLNGIIAADAVMDAKTLPQVQMPNRGNFVLSYPDEGLHVRGLVRRPWRSPGTSEERPALSPAEALSTFVVEPGYRIDLVAAEPLVQSPVAIAFDDRGRMYVAENGAMRTRSRVRLRPRRKVSSRA